MKPAYLIVLEGQGDVQVAVVDQEGWDWINRDDSAERAGNTGWDEFHLAPKYVQEQNAKYGSKEIIITCGSADNDRAIAVLDGLYSGEDETDAIQWLTANGYKLIDTYEGYIY